MKGMSRTIASRHSALPDPRCLLEAALILRPVVNLPMGEGLGLQVALAPYLFSGYGKGRLRRMER